MWKRRKKTGARNQKKMGEGRNEKKRGKGQMMMKKRLRESRIR